MKVDAFHGLHVVAGLDVVAGGGVEPGRAVAALDVERESASPWWPSLSGSQPCSSPSSPWWLAAVEAVAFEVVGVAYVSPMHAQGGSAVATYLRSSRPLRWGPLPAVVGPGFRAPTT